MPNFNIALKANIKNIQSYKKLNRITEDSRRGIRQAYYRAGKKTIFDINKDILRKPRFGRLYVINGRKHIASVPGEAPANLTGALRKSLDFGVSGYSNLKIGYDDSVPYGKWLEKGTEYIEPRPAIKINILKNNKVYDKFFTQELKKAFRRKGR